MRTLFHPFLPNGHGGDPAVWVDVQDEGHALLLDLGDLGRLSNRRLLRVASALVSHTHMDHFVGFDHLLRALHRCKKSGMRFRATIVGEGEQRRSLEELRDELGLATQVIFSGGLPQEQVRSLLAGAGLTVLACVPDDDGNMDALPTVLLESLALDVPIVSTRLTGIPEIVGQDGGLLVEPGDDEGLARAIRLMDERIRAGQQPTGRCRARAGRLFDLSRNVAELRGMFLASASARPVA